MGKGRGRKSGGVETDTEFLLCILLLKEPKYYVSQTNSFRKRTERGFHPPPPSHPFTHPHTTLPPSGHKSSIYNCQVLWYSRKVTPPSLVENISKENNFLKISLF